MSIQKLRDQKGKKNFFRNGFRNVLRIIYVSISLNVIFIIGIYETLINRVAPDYYATSGVKPPIRLTGLSHPNYSSEALLPPAPTESSVDVKVPQ
jgi:intracellular multiplication protein IcmM